MSDDSKKSDDTANLARLFAEQAASVAMMTAFGMGITSRMTGMFLGAVADAMEKSPNTTPGEAPVKSTAAKATVRQTKDDLKRISGIGPKIEKTLNDMGIGEFSIIAGWTEADAKKIDMDLGLSNRIIRDDWVAQAKKLLES